MGNVFFPTSSSTYILLKSESANLKIFINKSKKFVKHL
jgi:hypothetical protein